eukprot:TRINITY_DN13008_c0_g1_i1.p1 TRINITY_DN13008_c0_g1~~TRINITY_DN13008_c0_g1_i1.p1  ORF type:complete len:642 (+),score=138.67 TRINITY_DN13008_c0_g1_i1:79-2004(+)
MNIDLKKKSDPFSRIHDKKELSYESLSDDEKREYRRVEAIKELINTEKAYVEDLRVVVEVYIQDLKKKQIIETKSIKAIFSNIEMLLNVNREFTTAFGAESQKAPPDQNFGGIFIELVEYLKAYTQYSSDQEQSLQVIRSLRTNPEFTKFLEEGQRNPRCKGGTLLSYLIKPIQRLCKYPLLLKQIQNYLPNDHSDHSNITIAIDKVEKVVAQVNDSKMKIENVMKIMELQNSIDGAEHLVQPGRKFLREGELFTSESSKLKEHHIFLFSDLLMLCKPQSKRKSSNPHVLKYNIPLKCCLLENVPESEAKNAFMLVPLHDEEIPNTPERVRVATKTAEIKKEWMSTLLRLIQENTPDLDALPEMHTARESVTSEKKSTSRPGPGPSTGRPGPGRPLNLKFATVKVYSRASASSPHSPKYSPQVTPPSSSPITVQTDQSHLSVGEDEQNTVHQTTPRPSTNNWSQTISPMRRLSPSTSLFMGSSALSPEVNAGLHSNSSPAANTLFTPRSPGLGGQGPPPNNQRGFVPGTIPASRSTGGSGVAALHSLNRDYRSTNSLLGNSPIMGYNKLTNEPPNLHPPTPTSTASSSQQSSSLSPPSPMPVKPSLSDEPSVKSIPIKPPRNRLQNSRSFIVLKNTPQPFS